MPERKSRQKSKASKASRSSRKSRVSRETHRKRSSRHTLPKTAKLQSKASPFAPPRRFYKASEEMSLTDLQKMAKSRGIPFGGLTKAKLIRKINNY